MSFWQSLLGATSVQAEVWVPPCTVGPTLAEALHADHPSGNRPVSRDAMHMAMSASETSRNPMSSGAATKEIRLRLLGPEALAADATRRHRRNVVLRTSGLRAGRNARGSKIRRNALATTGILPTGPHKRFAKGPQNDRNGCLVQFAQEFATRAHGRQGRMSATAAGRGSRHCFALETSPCSSGAGAQQPGQL